MNLKKNGKLLTSKSSGNGPLSYERNLPGRGLTKIKKHWSIQCAPEMVSAKESGQDMELTTHLHLVSRLRTRSVMH